jgi:hypothetical protein
MFYMMETWHMSHADIMNMPVSRRYRLIQNKIELERKRAEAAEKRRNKK